MPVIFFCALRNCLHMQTAVYLHAANYLILVVLLLHVRPRCWLIFYLLLHKYYAMWRLGWKRRCVDTQKVVENLQLVFFYELPRLRHKCMHHFMLWILHIFQSTARALNMFATKPQSKNRTVVLTHKAIIVSRTKGAHKCNPTTHTVQQWVPIQCDVNFRDCSALIALCNACKMT